MRHQGALAIPQVLATSDGTKNLYGLERIGVEQGGAWRYPLPDALGSVRQWRGPAGAVLGVQSYGPFGEPRSPVAAPPWGRTSLAVGGVGRAPKGFTGEWQDPAGMVYLRARWYNPALGRFHQVDPVAGDLMVPATQHAYAYGLNSPLTYVDPTGRQPGAVPLPWPGPMPLPLPWPGLPVPGTDASRLGVPNSYEAGRRIGQRIGERVEEYWSGVQAKVGVLAWLEFYLLFGKQYRPSDEELEDAGEGAGECSPQTETPRDPKTGKTQPTQKRDFKRAKQIVESIIKRAVTRAEQRLVHQEITKRGLDLEEIVEVFLDVVSGHK